MMVYESSQQVACMKQCAHGTCIVVPHPPVSDDTPLIAIMKADNPGLKQMFQSMTARSPLRLASGTHLRHST